MRYNNQRISFHHFSHHHLRPSQLDELSSALIKCLNTPSHSFFLRLVNNPTWASKCPQKNSSTLFSPLCQKVSIDSNFAFSSSLSRKISLTPSRTMYFSRLLNNIDPHSCELREETSSEKMKTSREEKLSASAHDRHHTGLSNVVKVIISVDETASRMREIFVLYIFRVASLPHRKSIAILNVTNYTIHSWNFECKHRVSHKCH